MPPKRSVSNLLSKRARNERRLFRRNKMDTYGAPAPKRKKQKKSNVEEEYVCHIAQEVLVDPETMRKKEKNCQALASLKRRQEEGELAAIVELGIAYDNGHFGLVQDHSIAFMLFKRAALRGYGSAATRMGILLIEGRGIERNQALGMQYMFAAAVLGSEYACEHIGHSYANGINGYAKNEAEAVLWYKKMRDCKFRDSVEATRKRAQTFWERQ